jgi:hypothetical protein
LRTSSVWPGILTPALAFLLLTDVTSFWLQASAGLGAILQVGDVLDHLFGETGVGIDRDCLARSRFALALVEEGGALQALLERQ